MMIYYKFIDANKVQPGDYLIVPMVKRPGVKIDEGENYEVSVCVNDFQCGDVNGWSHLMTAYESDGGPGMIDGLPTLAFLKRFMPPTLAVMEYDGMRKG